MADVSPKTLGNVEDIVKGLGLGLGLGLRLWLVLNFGGLSFM